MVRWLLGVLSGSYSCCTRSTTLVPPTKMFVTLTVSSSQDFFSFTSVMLPLHFLFYSFTFRTDLMCFRVSIIGCI